jgi:hypothetical protein
LLPPFRSSVWKEMEVVVLMSYIAVLRFIKSSLRMGNHFLCRYFTKNDLFRPLIDLLEEESSRDNMLSSACMDVLDLIRKVGHAGLQTPMGILIWGYAYRRTSNSSSTIYSNSSVLALKPSLNAHTSDLSSKASQLAGNRIMNHLLLLWHLPIPNPPHGRVRRKTKTTTSTHRMKRRISLVLSYLARPILWVIKGRDRIP